MIQRVNWSDVKGEMNDENQISATPLSVSQNEKHDSSILDYIMNGSELLWIFLQVMLATY